MVKSVCNVTEFTKPMLYNCTKVVLLTLTNHTSGFGPAKLHLYNNGVNVKYPKII